MSTFHASTHEVDVDSIEFRIKRFETFVNFDVCFSTIDGTDVCYTLFIKDVDRQRDDVTLDEQIKSITKALKKNVSFEDHSE